MQQENQPTKSESPTASPAPSSTAGSQMAQNPNPRANENIKDTPMEENTTSDGTGGVGTEITDGEAG